MTRIKIITYAIALLVSLNVFAWFYKQGKQEAREECLAEQAKVIQLWEDKLKEAQEKNRVLAEDLAKTFSDLEKAKTVRTKRIVEYVQSNPDSNTVIFDADGLSILNDAQKGRNTSSQ